MEHSSVYEKAVKYYGEGRWTIAYIRALAKAGKLTMEEYKEITKEEEVRR